MMRNFKWKSWKINKILASEKGVNNRYILLHELYDIYQLDRQNKWSGFYIKKSILKKVKFGLGWLEF